MRYLKLVHSFTIMRQCQFSIATTESGGFTDYTSIKKSLPRHLTPLMLAILHKNFLLSFPKLQSWQISIPLCLTYKPRPLTIYLVAYLLQWPSRPWASIILQACLFVTDVDNTSSLVLSFRYKQYTKPAPVLTTISNIMSFPFIIILISFSSPEIFHQFFISLDRLHKLNFIDGE